jgi:excisionase family DNA binding protein
MPREEGRVVADESLLTPQQVAERLQVQVQTVVRWLRSGQLKGAKFGRIWRVTEEDLQAFIQEHRQQRNETS